jgi:hypothetical protein
MTDEGQKSLEQQKSLPIEEAYEFGRSKGLESEINSISQMKPIWDRYPSNNTLRRGYIVHLFQEKGIWQDFKQLHWPFGNTEEGEDRRTQRYLKRRNEYLRFIEVKKDQEEEEEEEEEEAAGQFGKEAHLRDFLANNPQCIEPGLAIFQLNGKSGVESGLFNALCSSS